MKIYLDDDCASHVLTQALRRAGHDVQTPTDAGLSGRNDAVHMRQAALEQRALLTRNHDDFEELHELLMDAKGHHSGIVVIRRDNDPKRNLKASGVVRAIANFQAAGLGLRDQYVILNQWR